MSRALSLRRGLQRTSCHCESPRIAGTCVQKAAAEPLSKKRRGMEGGVAQGSPGSLRGIGRPSSRAQSNARTDVGSSLALLALSQDGGRGLPPRSAALGPRGGPAATTVRRAQRPRATVAIEAGPRRRQQRQSRQGVGEGLGELQAGVHVQGERAASACRESTAAILSPGRSVGSRASFREGRMRRTGAEVASAPPPALSAPSDWWAGGNGLCPEALAGCSPGRTFSGVGPSEHSGLTLRVVLGCRCGGKGELGLRRGGRGVSAPMGSQAAGWPQ